MERTGVCKPLARLPASRRASRLARLWRARQAMTLGLAVLISGCGLPQKSPQAADFTLPTTEENGAPVTLSVVSQRSPVLLIFWATWCPSCVEEIPALNQLRARYPEESLQFLAINVQESRKQVRDFIKKNPMNYPVLLDETGEVASRYGLAGLPASVLLAKGGEILYYGFSLPLNLDPWLEARRAP